MSGSRPGSGDWLFALATPILIVRPSGCARFSGTVSLPQLNCGPSSSSGIPATTGEGHGVNSNDAAADRVAVDCDPAGSLQAVRIRAAAAMATATQDRPGLAVPTPEP